MKLFYFLEEIRDAEHFDNPSKFLIECDEFLFLWSVSSSVMIDDLESLFTRSSNINTMLFLQADH